MVYTSDIEIQSAKRTEVINITTFVKERVGESQISDGIVCLFSGHTSASVYLGIDDKWVSEDFIDFTTNLVPNEPDLKHNIYGGKNADSHLKSILFGNSITLPITGSEIDLGSWQGIFFAEFSGPRKRKLTLKIIGE